MIGDEVMHRKGKIFITLLVLTVLVVGGYFLALKTGVIWKEEVDEEKYRVRGIAVSEDNGDINWTQVKKDGNMSFAFIRATQGTMVKDKKYSANYVGATNAGLKIGIYHEFVYGNDISTQVKFYTTTVKVPKNQLKPVWKIMFDMSLMTEDDKIAFQDQMLDAALKIKETYDKNLMIYTTEKIYQELFSGSKFDMNNLVVENLKFKPLMMDASRWNFWQYKTDGTVPGITMPTCKLVYTNTPEDFENYIAHTK
ncbi:MAG: hypothetical protein E7262_03310 [Lachnospiraceae bacterium]|nr:hypothetical protein [Lachnospiraceae bacterium]